MGVPPDCDEMRSPLGLNSLIVPIAVVVFVAVTDAEPSTPVDVVTEAWENASGAIQVEIASAKAEAKNARCFIVLFGLSTLSSLEEHTLARVSRG